MWDRERERDAAPPPPRRFIKEEKEEDKGVQLPGVLNWFIGTLPAPNTFDGEFNRSRSHFCAVDLIAVPLQVPSSAPMISCKSSAML